MTTPKTSERSPGNPGSGGDFAPDTIWAWRFTGQRSSGGWSRAAVSHAEAEYIRKDVSDAAIAAAYEVAARIADTEARSAQKYTEEAICETYCTDIASEIRNLTPADARAEGRREALREAFNEGVMAAAKRNELTVRSIKEALDMRDWDAAREIAMKGPPGIRALLKEDEANE